MTALDDLDVVVEQYHLALGEFFKGNPEPAKMMFSHREDVSLAKPFGLATRGWKQVAETMERAASLYRDGEITGFENVAKYASAVGLDVAGGWGAGSDLDSPNTHT